MNMAKSRDIRGKMPSPKVIWNAFWLVTVRVLNSYETSYYHTWFLYFEQVLFFLLYKGELTFISISCILYIQYK